MTLLDVEKPARTPQLVRDKMTPREGLNEANDLLAKPLTIAMLVQKLFLEAAELAGDLKRPDEYGDVLDVLEALARANGVPWMDIERARAAKNRVKGRFDTGNFWTPEEFMND